MTEESPALYVVATPLGNLGDLTVRAQAVLKAVPWVAAEDTRHSAPLLRHLGSPARMLPAHQHNEEAAAQQVIDRLVAGESVALISDAGTPAVSDPGARLVGRVRAAGYKVVPLPGPCAAVAALSASGITAPHWLFYGFLPTKSKQREEVLRELAPAPHALVFYEAPHRILETVAALAATLGAARRIVIARELTKLFETIHACPLGEAMAWLEADANQQKGEFVLIVDAPEAAGGEAAEAIEAERVLALLIDEGLPVKQAAKLAHAITGAPKNALYDRALQLRVEK